MRDEINLSEDGGFAWIGMSADMAPSVDQTFCTALNQVLDRIEKSETANCVILSGAPKGFPRGFANTEWPPMAVFEKGRELLNRIENFPIPVVAVIPDGAINEGLELAMAAHYRVAAQNARFGITQISAGLIPAMGGTQRLPRLAGAKVALEMLLNGKLITAQEAQEAGLVDHVTGREFAKDVTSYLNELMADGGKTRPTKNLVSGQSGPERYQAQMNEARKMVEGYAGPAAHAIVDCVEAAQLMPLPTGLMVERSKFEACRASVEAHALRHVAIAEHRLMRPGPRSASAVNVLVIGARDGDQGLCVALLDAGLNVTVLDENGPPHPSMSGAIIAIYDKAVQLGRMRAEVRAARVARLEVSHVPEELGAFDIIIDAGGQPAAEVLDFMRAHDSEQTQVFLTARTGPEARELAGLVAEICPVAAFSFPREPHIARVVEVYGLAGQPPTVLQDACEFFRVAKRMPITVEEGAFELASQLRATLMEAAETLLLHGAEPRQIDGALVEFGFRLGPLAMRDEVGMQVDLVRGRQPATEALLAAGRTGRDSGLGYFRYAKRDPRPRADGVVVWSLSSTRDKMGITPIEFTPPEITKLVLGALANFGASLLDREVIQRASDLDVLAIHSINFPRRKGGPMQAIEQLGLFEVLQTMERHAKLNPQLWTPHNLIRDLVKYGQGFENMDLPDLDHAS